MSVVVRSWTTLVPVVALLAGAAGCSCDDDPGVISTDKPDLCKVAGLTACETAATCEDPDRYVCGAPRDPNDATGKNKLDAQCCLRSARRCTDDTGCCPGQVCADGRCVDKFDECATDDECGEAGDRVCETWSDPVLGESKRCTYKRCGSLGECPTGQSCFNDFCVASAPCGGSCPAGEACVPQNNRCKPYGDRCQVSCKPGFLAVYKNPDAVYDTCKMSEVACDCVELPPLISTDLGRHASIAAAGGTVYVSHYDGQYGDLVLSEFDLTGKPVKSTWVDGIPSGGLVVAGPSGARGGVEEPGDNVGKYADVAAAPDGTLHISYYDETNGDLRYVRRSSDGTWSSPVVVDGSDTDSGLYTSITLDPAGNPAIAYFQRGGSAVSPKCPTDNSKPSELVTGVKFARASTATPTSGADFNVEMVSCGARTPPPCFGCATAGATVCVDNGSGGTMCATPATNCPAACATGEVCVNSGGPKCMPQGNPIELADIPPGQGLFPSLAWKDSSPVIAWYDSTKGNLVVSQKGGSWTHTTVDGESTTADTGDVGLFPSLVIDASGKYNIAYHDYSRRSLRFYSQATLARVPNQTAPAKASIIDTGLIDPRLDGPSYVGADASLVLIDADAFVAYQNSTGVDLRLAKREPSGWTVQKEWTEGGLGFFADAIEHGGNLYIVHTRIHATTVEGRPTADNSLRLEVLPR